MILRSLAHDGRTWTVCLRVAPGSPSASGLEFIFIRNHLDGRSTRYAWPAEGDVLRALYEETTELSDRVLIDLLEKAVRANRTVDVPRPDGSEGGSAGSARTT